MDIRKKLKHLHDQEDAFNKEMGDIDNQIKFMLKRKAKFAKQISKNMKYRNELIKKL